MERRRERRQRAGKSKLAMPNVASGIRPRATAAKHNSPSRTQWQKGARLWRGFVAIETEVGVLLQKPLVIGKELHRVVRFQSISFNRGIDLCFVKTHSLN